MKFKTHYFRKTGLEENPILNKILGNEKIFDFNISIIFKLLMRLAPNFLSLSGNFAVNLFLISLQNFVLDLSTNETLKDKQKSDHLEELSKYQNKKISKYHVRIVESRIYLNRSFIILFEDMIRKPNSIENVSSIKNIHKRFEVLKAEFKSSLKSDEKLFWWLIADSADKIVRK